MESKEKLLLGEEINSHVTDHLMAGIEEIAGQRGEHYIRVGWVFYLYKIPNKTMLIWL